MAKSRKDVNVTPRKVVTTTVRRSVPSFDEIKVETPRVETPIKQENKVVSNVNTQVKRPNNIIESIKSLFVEQNRETNEDKIMLCEKMNFTSREAYKMLRTNLMFTLADSPRCKKVGVTSSIRGEGKSTTSINLAYTLAMANSRVLLIDMDLRLPSIANRLELDYKYGLSDFLTNTVTKKDIIHHIPKYKNLDVILAGTIPPNPSELIGTENLARFVKQLETSYDFIVFDLPPVNIVTDALVAKDLMDGQLVVVREGYSDKYSLANCVRQLQFVEMNILGFVYTNAGGTATYYSKYKNYKYKGNYKYKNRKYSYYKNGYGKYGYK